MALLMARAVMVAVALMAAAIPRPFAAQTITQEEALVLAFPEADSIQRRTAYLTEGQLAALVSAVEEGGEAPPGVVTYYTALRAGTLLGTAYFDAHRVRTLPQVIMIAVGPDARVLRVETLSFREPPEYRAPDRWLGLFRGKEGGEEVSSKGEVPNLTGATLTARATTRAVHRALALHRILHPSGGGGPSRP
jgi:hypothetical protein